MRTSFWHGRSIAIIVTAACFCAFAHAAAQSTKPAFSLTISTTNSTVTLGSPVMVKVTMKNESEHNISVYTENTSDQGGFVYKADVWDEKGSTAPETKFGRSIQGHDTPEELRREPYIIVTSGGEGSLAPGQTIIDQVNLNKLYDLSRPGKYTIRLRRFDLESNSFVLSNKVTVKVTQ